MNQVAPKNYGVFVHTPYQPFMGRWEGLCKTFDPKGNFLESSAVHMDVYWLDDTTWHLHEHFDNLFEAGETVYHTDIRVTGKTCYAKNEMVSIRGCELTPYNYIFTIESGVTRSTVYNNHYFIDPNNRRILTHKLRGGEPYVYQIQDFARVHQP